MALAVLLPGLGSGQKSSGQTFARGSIYLIVPLLSLLSLFFCCPVSVRFLSDLLSGLLSGLVCVGVIFAIIANSYDSSTLSGFASDHLFGLESG